MLKLYMLCAHIIYQGPTLCMIGTLKMTKNMEQAEFYWIFLQTMTLSIVPCMLQDNMEENIWELPGSRYIRMLRYLPYNSVVKRNQFPLSNASQMNCKKELNGQTSGNFSTSTNQPRKSAIQVWLCQFLM